MTEYLIEAYVSRAAAARLGAQPGRHDLAVAAEDLTREGKSVRFVRSIFVPEDEVCFYLFEAQSTDAVREAAARCGLLCERVLETITDQATRDHEGA